MILPEEYQTGNSKFDEKVARALLKDPRKLTPGQLIQLQEEPTTKKPRIPVAVKDLRTYKDGTVFASAGELARWDYLLKMQTAGEIKNLKRQVPFILDESFIHKQWGDIPDIIYVADFTYLNITMRKEYPNRECVEDSKGRFLSDKYKIKRRWFLRKFAGLLFFEVYE